MEGGRKLSTHLRRFCALAATLTVSGSGLLTAGCGSVLPFGPSNSPLFVSGCHQPGEGGAYAAVLLDWTGGASPIYPGHEFTALDLSLFPTADGGTLADTADLFQQRVGEEIARIYCDWPDASVAVAIGEDHVEGLYADTVVHLTQNVRPDGKMDIGQAEYDPCDMQNDNSALIFGERLRQLGTAYTFEEWVHVFANVCAHEIAHTLGYAHIAREQRPEPERSLYVELMLDRHTMEEMRHPHRFIGQQDYCPSTTTLAAARVQSATASTCSCSH